VAALWSGLALIDPALGLSLWPAVAAALVCGILMGRSRRFDGAAAFLVLLGVVFAVQAVTPSNLGADSRHYFVWLPWLLRRAHGAAADLGDTLQALGMAELPPDAPLRRGLHPIGPALLWSPLFVLAHLYVLALRGLGRTVYAADGVSVPYVRAAALGTGIVVSAGVLALVSALRRRHAPAVAVLAVSAIVLGSTLPYYLAVQPLMAHGIVFGLAALLLWACVEVERDPTPRRWAVAGAVLGLLVLSRWQAVVAAVLPGALAAREIRHRRAGRGPLVAAALALTVFAPQMLVWHAWHGRWITMPQGAGYVDWSSPHLTDVLLSADRGLLSWTPIALIGVLGLFGAWPRWGRLAGASLAIVALTAWVNGGVSDWAGSDAFGARRFDVAFPLLAIGVAVAAEWTAGQAARHPLAAPAALLGLLAAWSLGLARLHARGGFPEAAPFEDVAAQEARLVRHGAERGLGALLGARGRDLAYRFFVGEYFYENANPGGSIAVGGDDPRWLGEGWSSPRWHEGGPRFRWALYPRACVRVPLAGPATLPATLQARVPRRLETQTFTVTVNGTEVAKGPLGPEWQDVPFTIPAAALSRGENSVCFQFERGWGEDGQQVGAQVARIQLP